MLEADIISETSVEFLQTTRNDKPEDNNLQIRREKLKTHIILELVFFKIF